MILMEFNLTSSIFPFRVFTWLCHQVLVPRWPIWWEISWREAEAVHPRRSPKSACRPCFNIRSCASIFQTSVGPTSSISPIFEQGTIVFNKKKCWDIVMHFLPNLRNHWSFGFSAPAAESKGPFSNAQATA